MSSSSMDDDALARALTALQAEVQVLRARVDTLSTALEQAHGQREATLKRQLRCPACGGRRVLHAEQVVDRSDGGTKHRMALTTIGFWSPRPHGEFECYVCTDCGFVEWYVKEPSSVEPDQKVLRIIEADPASEGPYR